MSANLTFNNIFAYVTGHIRHFLYNRKSLAWLIRTHIKEQIKWRIKTMNPLCYSQGNCIKCGCATPELQMASKACIGRCYPKMMKNIDWKLYKEDNNINLIQEDNEPLEDREN